MNNKRGFSLVELVIVIAILGLVMVIVATKGFGAFDTAKGKINSMNEEAINEAIEIIKLDIENCDGSDDELLDMFEVSNCGDLYTKLESGANVSLDKMIEKEYIAGAGIEEIKKEEIYDVTFKKIGEDISTEIKNEKKKAVLLKRNNISSTERYYSYKDKIVEVYFVDYVDIEGKTHWDVTNNSISNTKVYAWLENTSGGNYKLYFGSETKIYAPTDFSSFFKEFSILTNISFDNLDTSNVENMSWLFSYCTNLQELNLSNFDTSNVKNMYTMFYNCKSLTSLDLSNFNTEKVRNMSWLFGACDLLTHVNLSSFNTEEVTNMEYMFYYCKSLINLNLSSFNTEKVNKMSKMFDGCKSLVSLNMAEFSTKDDLVTTNMLYSTNKLESICLDKEKAYKIYDIMKTKGIAIACP